MAVEAPRRARDHPRWSTLIPAQTSSSTSPPQPHQRQQRRQRLQHLQQRFNLSAPPESSSSSTVRTTSALGPNYSPSEHTLRNDYSQRFVDTGAGQLPSNAVRNPGASTRFDEYPKLKRLVQLKDALVTQVAHPPTFLRADLRPSLEPFRDASRPVEQFHLGSLIPVKYDVVLIDPPLEAYGWEATPPATAELGAVWTWDEIAALPVPQLAAKESFVFLWVGSGAGDGLERGREVLAKWGYRRCEDIVCIRTNPEATLPEPSTSSAFARASQHCLMGIRGTVRRSTDVRFVHCNIDTDVILWPGPDSEQGRGKETERGRLGDMVSKPPELYSLIENFCLGTRRLELFGRNRNLRRGWLTIGLEVGPEAEGWPADGRVALPSAGLAVLQEQYGEGLGAHLEHLQRARRYDKPEYDAHFGVDRPGCDLRDRSNLVPYVEEVEQLRPKSPSRDAFRNGNARQGGQMPNGLSQTRRGDARETAEYAYPPMAPHRLPLGGAVGSAGGVGGGGCGAGAGGAGLSGLGAGGARTVSVPSGSDTLSGPQASVLKAKALAQANAAAATSATTTTTQ